ncbi:WG repeat-containing protein [Larkinella insperata]|uniref:WG repeat-containing protein n=1 Tax=Larkinella insperata TaxID=332158 RepID=A0ABW3QLW9_9BACT|nr:WG repeat-containing protein [Larkinella insperata]
MFLVIPNDETILTQEIMGYLLEHNYEALKTPEGQSLRERLISTDWRQKEETKWVPEPQPLPIATDVSVHPVAIPLSQSNKVLIALVILFVSVLLWLWKGKLSAIDKSSVSDSTESLSSVGSTAVAGKEVTTQSNAALVQRPHSAFPGAATPVAKEARGTSPASKSEKVLETSSVNKIGENSVAKPYDAVDDRVGDFGLRAARKGSKWGYVDQKDQWHIDPVYDDVTPFQNGKAVVMLDGQQISIDRDGVRIREDE